MKGFRWAAFCAVLVIATLSKSAFLFAQEAAPAMEQGLADAPASLEPAGGIDELFDEPSGDQVAPPSEGSLLDAFVVSKGTSFFGKLSLIGGGALGWTIWPDLRDPLDGFDVSPGLTGTATIGFDARPASNLRMQGKLSSELDLLSGSYWSAPTVSELYVDYGVGDLAFFRVGKYSIAWGQGRLFNPGNLMEDSSEGLAARLSFPTVASGFAFVALANPALFAHPAAPSSREVAVAGLLDTVMGGLRGSFGVRYQLYEGFRALLSLKTVVLGTDLALDGVGRYKDGVWGWEGLAGFFHEWKSLKIYGEYWIDADPTDTIDQRLGLALALRRMGGSGLDGGLLWLHDLSDGSGRLVIGLSSKPLPRLTFEFGLPFTYGEIGSLYYTIENEDHSKFRAALALKVTFDSAF